MQHGFVMRVVVVSCVGHHTVDPSGVMRRYALTGAPNRGLRLAAPVNSEPRQLLDAGCGNTRRRTGQGVEKIDLGRGYRFSGHSVNRKPR